MNNNGKCPRRNTGGAILDMHPTQLRCGEDTDMDTQTKSEQRIVATEKKFQSDNFQSPYIKGMTGERKYARQPAVPIPEPTYGNNTNIKSESDKTSEKENKARTAVNTVLCAVFALTLIMGGIFSVFHMTGNGGPRYSEYEKRNLQEAPEPTLSAIADGSYAENFDKFFSDNFPMREEMVKGATTLKRFRGIRAFIKDAKQVIHGDNDIYSDGEMEIIVNEEKFSNAPQILIPGLDTVNVQIPAESPEKNENMTYQTPNSEETETPVATESQEAETLESAADESEKAPEVQATNSDTTSSSVQTNTPSQVPATDNKPSESPEKQPESGVLKGDKRDTIYIIGDTAYEYFRGNIKSSNDYINVINTYAKYIPENINIYTLVIPTHPEFGLTGADRSVSNDQKPILDHIGNNLDARVIFVDPYAKLQAAYNNGEYLYFRTDHHWTIRGAYCAYAEFCETAGITPVPSEDYEKGVIEPFLGTFYSASGREQALANNPDYVEYFMIDIPCTVTRYSTDNLSSTSKGKLYYKSVRGTSNGYLSFMGGDFPYVHIKTENTNGKKLMIFKESFGNPLIGLLAPHFEEIHVADIRYFPLNSVNFITQYGITDVLFCNGIMSANSKARINDLLELMNK